MQQKPLNWGAILVGWAVKAFIGGFVVNVMNGIVMASSAVGMFGQMSKLPRGTQPTPQQVQNLAMQMQQRLLSPTLLISSVLLGTLFLILGGFIAGKMAGHSEVRHATFVGIISFVIAVVTSLSALFVTTGAKMGAPGSGFGVPMAAILAPILLSIPMAMLGGMLAEMTRKPEGRNLLAADGVAGNATPDAFDAIPRV